MDLLLPPIQKPVNLKINLKNCSPDAKEQNPMNNQNSLEGSRIPTSATSSKSGEIVDAIINPEVPSHMTTKTESSGAKDIQTCFCCFWIFPQSFRGEEKNIHIDRCMEGLGDKDKRLWTRCKGDLKQYRYFF